ncbi:hypothetical protein [Natrinema sp. J7-1]|uniref:hypothetical protein n=1 Tax=Natrinema sp. J7-1 TaxID=1172566 RepID=UPI0006779DB6|nr:hypothetical protein [Natrinema sp. J7-1]
MTRNPADSERTDSRSSRSDDAVEASPVRTQAAARADRLAEENARLRAAYARSMQGTSRHTARWLAVIGAVAVLGGGLFHHGRPVLFALGATGLFGAVLTYYLTPGRFVAATVGDCVSAAAANAQALVDDLALEDPRRYLPGTDPSSVRLFVPQRADSDPPADAAGPFVTRPAERGLVLEPTGGRLLAAFERTLDGPLPAEPTVAATRLADGLVEQFELASEADPAVDPDDGRATVAVRSSVFGDVDRFDHPVASFLAVGFAAALDRPVDLEVEPGADRSEWLITCRWDPA